MGKPTATVYWTLVVQGPAWHFYQRGFAMRHAFSGSRARWRHDRGAGSARVAQTGRFAGDDARKCARCEQFVNFRSRLTWQRDIGTETHAVRWACFAGRPLPAKA